MKNVILLIWPWGVGKTTIAELLRDKHGYHYLDGDHEDTEFFPKWGQWEKKNYPLLKKAHKKILDTTKKLVDAGKKVVVDYIVFYDHLDYIQSFKNSFPEEDLQIVILTADPEIIIQRDTARECWTTWSEMIWKVLGLLEEIREEVWENLFLDTTNLSADEVTREILKRS